MADYSNNEKATDLDVLTTLASDDVVVVGDTSDSGKAKAITKDNLKTQMESGLVNATATDTTANYLDSKFEITSDDSSVLITKTIQNAGANEKIVYDLSASGGGGSGGGGGGTKIAIDTTETTVTGNTSPNTVFTIPIPANTLGTNNAIRFKVVGSEGAASAVIGVTYGGETITSATTLGGNSDWEVNGMIIADGSTGVQKSIVSLLSEATNSPDEDFQTQTVDSTVEQDLIVTVTLNSGADTVVVESIVVEGINTGTGVVSTFTPQPLAPITAIDEGSLATNTTMNVGLVSLPYDMTVASVSVWVDTVVANGTLALAIYSEDGQTRYVSVNTATLSGTPNTVTTAITPVTLTAGLYYVAYHPNGTGSFPVSRYQTTTYPLFDDIVTYSGTITITASTTPATIDPTAISVGNTTPAMRFNA